MNEPQRPNSHLLWQWHVAINHHAEDKHGLDEWPRAMYAAKDVADEVPRMAMLFAQERKGELSNWHYQCSHDADGKPINDNHLSCCLGTECRKCPMLLALDKIEAQPEQIDMMKAWTCAAHILMEYGAKPLAFDTSEGFIKTEGDKMYWAQVYENLANAYDPDEDEAHDED